MREAAYELGIGALSGAASTSWWASAYALWRLLIWAVQT